MGVRLPTAQLALAGALRSMGSERHVWRRLLKESSFDQHGFRGALFMSSSRDGRTVRIEPLIGLIRSRADSSHYERGAARVAKLIVAACREHNGRIFFGGDHRLAVSSRGELRFSLENQKH